MIPWYEQLLMHVVVLDTLPVTRNTAPSLSGITTPLAGHVGGWQIPLTSGVLGAGHVVTVFLQPSVASCVQPAAPAQFSLTLFTYAGAAVPVCP
jgi:hypothetical protein